MTILDDADYARLCLEYRGIADRDWKDWHARQSVKHASEISAGATDAWLRRDKKNYRGIGAAKSLRNLHAGNVDQAYLDEIGSLENLERLDLDWPFLAHDLSPLLALPRLRFLRFDSPRNISDFTSILDLPELTSLFIVNAKHVVDLEWLSGAERLRVIGVEGSMWTKQKIASFAPLTGLPALEALFATTITLRDRDLSPLAACPRLKLLDMACEVPRREFDRLHGLRPDLACGWFSSELWDCLEDLRKQARNSA